MEILEREGMKWVGEMDNGLVCFKIVWKSLIIRVVCLVDVNI